VEIHIQNAPLTLALEKLLKDLPLTYEIDKKTILIREKMKAAANLDVRGRVVDSVGNPLPGASIRVVHVDGQRTALETSTDSNGEFILKNVPEDAILQISYVGYTTQTVKATANLGSIALRVSAGEI